MKVITCASYYGSGSSAIIDLISEYKSVKNLGNYEFRFLHDMDGVSDLEFHLIECPNRHNTGHAIKRFERLIHFYSGSFFEKRYEKFFDYEFLKISNDYLSEMIDFKYKGWWFYDLYDKGRALYNLKQLENHFLKIFTRKPNNILKNEKTYCSSIDENRFLEITRNYTSKLFCAANKENNDYLVIDQLVPSQNIDRIMRYFKDDVYVFVVDRDPRDIYLSEMLKWKECVIPHDPSEFCKWYRFTHTLGSKSIDKKIIYINFEDLIYKYADTVKKIENVLNLSAECHLEAFSRFNPRRSLANTRIFERTKEYENAISLIESELSEFLYDFSSVNDNSIMGFDDSDNGIF